MRLRTPVLGAGLLLALTGCSGGGSADPTTTVTETVTVTASPEAAPPETSEVDPGGAGGAWAQTYQSPAEIIDIVDADVMPCEPNEGDAPATTGYSDLAISCFYERGDGAVDDLTAATYVTEEQQAQALEYFLAPGGGPDPGATYVSGPGFTIKLDASRAEAIAERFDAFVLN